MKRLIKELNERASQLDNEFENAKSERLGCVKRGRLMEVERTMDIMIDLGLAEALLTNTLPVMQIKAVEVC